MKRDKKTETQKKLLKLDRTTVRQLENQDLERVNGGAASWCQPTICSN